MSDRKEIRFLRRLQVRRETRRLADERAGLATPVKHPLGDPRIGDDRRQLERRARAMSPDEVDDWLKRNGISGGDRRRGDRRQGDRRRQ